MAKYKVVSGIMQGLIFNGHSVNIGGEFRIWNDDSTGQSFPSENCIEVTESVYVVAYRDKSETGSDSEAWNDGDFEPYNWYDTIEEATKVKEELNTELKNNNRKDAIVFVKKCSRLWAERYLA